MSVKHAVLGLVIERPGYGYQLAQRLEERCGLWGWQPSGVYGALNQLEHDEHVRRVGERPAGSRGRGARRVIYEATEPGREAFRDWIFEATPQVHIRGELELKITVAGPEFVGRLMEQTRAQEQQCIDDLRALTRAAPRVDLHSWRDAAVMLERDYEMRMMRVRIQWLQDVRQTMVELLRRLEERGLCR